MGSNAERIAGTALRIATDFNAAMSGAYIGAGIVLHEPVLIVSGAGFALTGGTVLYFNERIGKEINERLNKDHEK